MHACMHARNAGNGSIRAPSNPLPLRCKRARSLLDVDSWAMKFRYDSVCHVLEQGINTHFIYNNGVSIALLALYHQFGKDTTVNYWQARSCRQ